MNKLKYNFLLIFIISTLFISCNKSDTKTAENYQLEQDFINPPTKSRPYTWWHWMHGNVSKEGITKDLEMMKEVGIGGAEIFETANNTPSGHLKYGSDEWLEYLAYTAKEAKRLGIEFGINNAAGWSCTGGPWVTPEYASKILCQTETYIVGGGKKTVHLKKPKTDIDYYQDIKVLAYPAKKDGFRITDWKDKTFQFRWEHTRVYRHSFDKREVPKEDIILHQDVLDLSPHLKEDGSIQYNFPKGNWVILRLGYTISPRTNVPASKEGTGFEIDKFNPKAVDFHWKKLLNRVMDTVNKNEQKLKLLNIDSYESCYSNWTKEFPKEFAKRTGYDFAPWIPCLSGRVVQSLEMSERFMWDYRRVCADLMIENFYEQFSENCKEHNIQLVIEPYGIGPFDSFEAASIADIPAGEFWAKRPFAWHVWSSKLASSSAHVYGKKYVAAESYTATNKDASFINHPYSMKSKGDYFFTQGVNRFTFHTWAHQPWNESVKPGMTMGPHGIQMNRNNTWVPKSSAYFDYLARSQYLLQEGYFVADLLYVYSENAPNAPEWREMMDPMPPKGYDYDVAGYKVLQQLKVVNGLIVTPAGMNYKILVLPYEKYQTSIWENQKLESFPKNPNNIVRWRPETIKEIQRLANAGATIVAPKPVFSPSLTNYPTADAEVKKIANLLWDNETIQKPEHLSQVLKSMHIQPDFEAQQKDINYIHRNIKGSDFYFVANPLLEQREITCSFRVEGKLPELWNPENGKITTAKNWRKLNDGRTEVTLDMTPAGAVFVVFRNDTDKTGMSQAKQEYNELLEINNNWMVTFDPKWGLKDPVVFKTLIPWNQHNTEEIKYYSGSATYKTTFYIQSKNEKLYLDLGKVAIMAHVKINSKDLGLLWKPPYRIEITAALKKGDNTLEIEVTNLWPNRLIGDEKRSISATRKEQFEKEFPQWLLDGKSQPDSIKRKTYVAFRHYKKEDQLLSSGLIGPVKILSSSSVPIN